MTTSAPSATAAPTTAILPFKVHVPQVAVDDLRTRLAATRWPDQELAEEWEQGVPRERAQELLAHWRDAYDWRAFEARINAFPQYKTTIDGLGIHFLHVRSKHPDALPMILTHGWPGSVVMFLNLIGPLTDPTAHGGRSEDAFHVVIPSLPGYGFSDRPSEPGWERFRTARAWSALMARLGYARWVAQGGDWGSTVTHVLAQQRPDGLVAAHVNWPLVVPAEPAATAADEDLQVYADIARHADSRGRVAGYFRQQSTRPQTLAYGLTDSPVGLATWLYEKFHDWTDHEGTSDALPTTEMLDDISLYWFTGTAGSAARYYWENMHACEPFSLDAGPIDLPMAATVFPEETIRPPRAWAERRWSQIIYWGTASKGGHLAAWEQPAIFVDELRNAFRSIRDV